MRKVYIRILISLIIVIYLLLRFITTEFYSVDFPCFVDIKNKHLTTDYIDSSDTIKDLIVFISVWPEHASGAGCNNYCINKGQKLDFSGFNIELIDSTIKINKTILNPQDTFQCEKIKIKPVNLWWIYDYKLKLKYYGKIDSISLPGKEIKLLQSRYLLIGDESTEDRINYLTLGLFVGLIVYIIVLIIKLIRNKNTTTNNKGSQVSGG